MDVKKLFVLGDSISEHYGPHLERMTRGVFEYARKEANGGDSSMVLAYLCERLDVLAPDILLLNCGLHDLRTDPKSGAKQVSLWDYRQNLCAIAQLVSDRDMHTTWVRTTPVDDDRHNTRQAGFHRFNRDVIHYNESADAVCGEAGIPLADLYTFTQNLGEDVFADGVHFVEWVRELQAAFIAGYLLATPGQPSPSGS